MREAMRYLRQRCCHHKNLRVYASAIDWPDHGANLEVGVTVRCEACGMVRRDDMRVGILWMQNAEHHEALRALLAEAGPEIGGLREAFEGP